MSSTESFETKGRVLNRKGSQTGSGINAAAKAGRHREYAVTAVAAARSRH